MLAKAFALLLSIAASPQLPFDARAADPYLMRYEAVQKELHLSPDQVARVKRAIQDYNAEAKRTGSWNSDRERAAVSKYLDAAQLRRLREISMQSAGPVVLIVDFIAERIGASPARQRQIQNTFNGAIEEGLKPMNAQIEKMTNEVMRGVTTPEEAEKRSQEISRRAEQISGAVDQDAIQKVAVKRVYDSLTPKERAAWQALQGAPFPVDKLEKSPKSWD